MMDHSDADKWREHPAEQLPDLYSTWFDVFDVADAVESVHEMR
jgi:hypothetical protein